MKEEEEIFRKKARQKLTQSSLKFLGMSRSLITTNSPLFLIL